MNTFQNIVTAFNGYDMDHKGVKEIEALTFLSFEKPAESIDPGKKLVLVIVESRLLKNLPGSHFTTDDLLNRLKTFKKDLNREGRQSRFLQMTIYSGALHQDGRTVLAIREFFKSVMNSFPNFEGAILVGSFPEASIARSYPLYLEDNQDKRYNVGFNIEQPERFEIVLADLDGNWGNIYYESVEVEAQTFHVLPTTKVTQNGSKVTLLNPKIEKRNGVLKDIFWIKDAAYTVKNVPKGVQVEFDLNCQNPEVSMKDKQTPNPVAKPDIIVSRINPRSAAVQPPDPRLLDVNGKPQETPNKPPINFSMESWVHDPKLERSLLIDYFDRNHAFRAGMFSDRGFKVGLLEAEVGTFAADEGAEGISKTRDEVKNATLVDMIKWFKKDYTFRIISTHANSHFTFLQRDDANYANAESEAGGHPWRWIEESGKYKPSFKEHYSGDLYLYRTLWENKKMSNITPSLMLHIGCKANGVSHNELPFSNLNYGDFQNAESLLFYANQLAIICRATVWNRGPMGFGKAFGASLTATMGDGWKNVSQVIAHDVQMAKQSTERKQNYMWSIVGDWTLQKYYPAWSYGRKVNEVDSTPKLPASCTFNNKLYLFWKASDSSNRIYYSYSSDGTTWSKGRQINSVDSTSEAPNVCVFNNMLYVFWKASDEGNRIYYSASSDGINWPNGRKINNVDSTQKVVSTCVYKNKLYIFWKSSAQDNRIYFSASADGLSWPAGWKVNDNDSTLDSLSSCVFNNKLYLFWKANDAENRIYCSCSTDGMYWPNAHRINDVDSTPLAPAAYVYNNKLYLFWKANDSGNGIFYSSSSDGAFWPNAKRINDFDSTQASPAPCVFQNDFYLFWVGNNSSKQLYYSQKGV